MVWGNKGTILIKSVLFISLVLILIFLVSSTEWDVSTATYDNKSFLINPQDEDPTGVFFNSSGNKMYIVGNIEEKVFQYTLSTPWDVSTATYDNKNVSVSQEPAPKGVFFNSSGNKMYIVGGDFARVFQYTLSTPWDVSTATYDNKNLSVTTQDSDPTGVFFNSSGNKMYIMGNTGDTVFQYTLSTPWDVSTASYDIINVNVTTQENLPQDLFFNSSGNKMYIVGSTSDTVFQYTLSTPWNISTATYDNKNFSVVDQDTAPLGLFFNSSGNKMQVVGTITNRIYLYSLPSSADPTITNISVSQGLDIFSSLNSQSIFGRIQTFSLDVFTSLDDRFIGIRDIIHPIDIFSSNLFRYGFLRDISQPLSLNSFILIRSVFDRDISLSIDFNSSLQRIGSFFRTVIQAIESFFRIFTGEEEATTSSTGGGGGGTGFNLNTTICNYTYIHLLKYGDNPSNLYPTLLQDQLRENNIEITLIRLQEDYIDSFQGGCSEVILRTLKPEYVCTNVRDFLTERDFEVTIEEIDELRLRLKGVIEISNRLLTHYINNYNDLCFSYTQEKLPEIEVKEVNPVKVMLIVGGSFILIIFLIYNKKFKNFISKIRE